MPIQHQLDAVTSESTQCQHICLMSAKRHQSNVQMGECCWVADQISTKPNIGPMLKTRRPPDVRMPISQTMGLTVGPLSSLISIQVATWCLPAVGMPIGSLLGRCRLWSAFSWQPAVGPIIGLLSGQCRICSAFARQTDISPLLALFVGSPTGRYRVWPAFNRHAIIGPPSSRPALELSRSWYSFKKLFVCFSNRNKIAQQPKKKYIYGRQIKSYLK